MKTNRNYRNCFIIALCAFGLFGLLGCHEKTTVANNDNQVNQTNQVIEAAPATLPPAVVLETPKPVITAPARTPSVTPPPVVTPPHILQEGSFILIVYKSVETPDSIKGYKPGSMLTKQGEFLVTGEGDKLTLKENEYTNDLDIAQKYISADQLAQARAKYVPTTPVPSATPAPPDAPAQTTPVPSRGGTSLDKGAHNKIDSHSNIRTDDNGRRYKIVNGKVVYLD